MNSMTRVSLFGMLLVSSLTAASAAADAKGAKGGKGGKCGKKQSPCTDGSHPQCAGGAEPDRSSMPPSCVDGGSPLCKDGSEPEKPPRGDESGRRLQADGAGQDDDDKDGDCSGGISTKVVIVCAVGGSALLISVCACVFCWRRAANLARAHPKAEQVAVGKAVDRSVGQDAGIQGSFVVGQPAKQVDSGRGVPEPTGVDSSNKAAVAGDAV